MSARNLSCARGSDFLLAAARREIYDGPAVGGADVLGGLVVAARAGAPGRSGGHSVKLPPALELEALWAHHHAQWRDPAQVVSRWQQANQINPGLLQHRVRGAWWEALAETKATLLITREYEHLVMAMAATRTRPRVSYLPLPHPSGLVVDRSRQIMYVASTRNPNQLYELRPAGGSGTRLDPQPVPCEGRPLVPVRSFFLPGCFYLHDLGLIGQGLYASAVGHNSVVRFFKDGRYQHVWWPKCIERNGRPVLGWNQIQLNSIAAGRDLDSSFFSASTDAPSSRRPGHRNFVVNRSEERRVGKEC